MIAACVFASAIAGGGAPPYGAPVASFSPSTPIAPIYSTINFYDTSTGTPTSWVWRLNAIDGPVFSILQNPSYFFTSPGFYDIFLIATNSYGSDSYSVQIEIFNES